MSECGDKASGNSGAKVRGNDRRCVQRQRDGDGRVKEVQLRLQI
jgi:hypothetical protein